MSTSRRWYMPVLVIAVAVIGGGAAFSVPSTRGWRALNPFAKRDAAATATSRSLPTRKQPPATVVQQAQPAPQPQSAPVAVTSDASSVLPARTAPRWRPSDKQRLRDRVYLAGKQNRPNDAIAALEAWDAKHPGDAEVLRELARLLVRGDRSAEAFVRYRALLAIAADTAIRAEYAAALLALQQYDSAAANYRLLIDADSTNLAAHLGRARALAWGNHPRDAEPELRWVVRRLPQDTSLVAMLRLARAAYDPSAAEAHTWVMEDPSFAPYRLALARAYVREQRIELSLAHFDTVLATDRNAPLALLREAAGAHATAGDSTGNARLLGRAVSLAPSDPMLRQSYADALAWSGQRTLAVAQYDTLLMAGLDAEILTARGRLHALLGNGPLAERDLACAVSLVPSPAAWVMLGDIYRWRGDRVHAREAYARAISLSAGDAGAAAGLEAIIAAERRERAAMLSHDLGWRSSASYLGDNTGFSLYTAGLSGALAVGDHTALTVGADARRLEKANGRALDVGLLRYVGSFRFAGDAGIARYDGLGDFGSGSLSAAGPLRGMWAAFDLRTGPAYQWLMSSRTLTFSGGSATLTVPTGRGALTGGVDRMWLSDGNARTALQLGARYALGYGLSAIYSGGVIGFNRASNLYWNPKRFTSHAAGLELSTQRDSGLSFSARVLPGIGLAPDMFTPSTTIDRNAAQLSSGFALDYRRRWWLFGIDGEYARGVRDSGYHSARANVRFQITP